MKLVILSAAKNLTPTTWYKSYSNPRCFTQHVLSGVEGFSMTIQNPVKLRIFNMVGIVELI